MEAYREESHINWVLLQQPKSKKHCVRKAVARVTGGKIQKQSGPNASRVGQLVDYIQKKRNTEAQEVRAMAFQNIHCLSTERRWRGEEATAQSTVGRLPSWSREKQCQESSVMERESLGLRCSCAQENQREVYGISSPQSPWHIRAGRHQAFLSNLQSFQHSP